jgi:hypothetical protein
MVKRPKRIVIQVKIKLYIVVLKETRNNPVVFYAHFDLCFGFKYLSLNLSKLVGNYTYHLL